MRFHPYAELFPLMDEAALQELADDIGQNGLQQPIWTLDGQILDGRNRWKACRIANVECKAVEYEGDDPLGFVVSLNLHRRQLTPSQRAMIGVELEAHRAREVERKKAEKCRAMASLQPRDALGRLGPGVSGVPQKIGEPGHPTESAAMPHRGDVPGTTSPSAPQLSRRIHVSSRGSESARQAAKELGVNHDYISKAKRIVHNAPELVTLVRSGVLTLQDATLLATIPEGQREQLLSTSDGRQDIKKAIAKAKARSLEAGDRQEEARKWVPADELSRLRDCFAKVLAGYINNSNGDFESLLDYVKEWPAEIERARQAYGAK
jgi:hypothetical protein